MRSKRLSTMVSIGETSDRTHLHGTSSTGQDEVEEEEEEENMMDESVLLGTEDLVQMLGGSSVAEDEQTTDEIGDTEDGDVVMDLDARFQTAAVTKRKRGEAMIVGTPADNGAGGNCSSSGEIPAYRHLVLQLLYYCCGVFRCHDTHWHVLPMRYVVPSKLQQLCCF